MKKIYVSLFLSAAAYSFAQHQLTQANHAPVNGESYQMYEVDPSSVSEGPSGTGLTWNFTAATVHTNVVNSYTAVTASNTMYPGANVAVGTSSDNISYLSSGTGELRYFGGNISVQTVKATLNYSAPAIYAVYPMSVTTTSTAAIGGSLTVTSPMSANGTFSGNCSVEADGSGTLILTSDTFQNVLRVRVTQTLDFALTGGFGLTGTLVLSSYEWYSPNVKEPLFTITSGTANVAGTTYLERLAAQNKDALSTTSIGEQFMGYVGVYPEAGYTLLNVVLPNHSATLDVFDLAGRKVATYRLHKQRNQIDISHYNGGLYLFNIKSEAGKLIHSGRFNVGR